MLKRTVIDQIEITRDGTISLRFAKEIVDDNGEVLTKDWHRTVLPPGHDIDGQMLAVNEHLETMNCVAVDESELTRAKDIAAKVWTASTIAAHRAKLAASAQVDRGTKR